MWMLKRKTKSGFKLKLINSDRHSTDLSNIILDWANQQPKNSVLIINFRTNECQLLILFFWIERIRIEFQDSKWRKIICYYACFAEIVFTHAHNRDWRLQKLFAHWFSTHNYWFRNSYTVKFTINLTTNCCKTIETWCSSMWMCDSLCHFWFWSFFILFQVEMTSHRLPKVNKIADKNQHTHSHTRSIDCAWFVYYSVESIFIVQSVYSFIFILCLFFHPHHQLWS